MATKPKKATGPKTIKCTRYNACGTEAPMHHMRYVNDCPVCYMCYLGYKKILDAFVNGDQYVEIFRFKKD